MATASGNGNASRGIHSTALAYTGAIYIPLPNNAITSVGAQAAEEVVNQKMGIAEKRRAKMDAVPPTNPLNPFQTPTPIGDIEWGWMILLALGYAGLAWRKKYNAHE
jgi:hypothetical protein